MNKRRERPPLSDRGRRRALRTWGFYLLALTAWVTVVLAAVFLGYLVCSAFTWYAWDPLYQFLNWVRDYIVFVCMLVILLGWVAISYSFIARPMRLVDTLAAAAEQLAQPGEEPIELPEPMEDLEGQLNAVRERALRDARAAREAEQRKNDLVVYLAHDLKTPLTSVIGYLTLLRDEPQLSPELRSRYTGIALEKAERLEDLINEFFDITRFSLTHLELEKQPTDLTRMLEQVASEFAPQFAEKDLRCERLPLQLPGVHSPDHRTAGGGYRGPDVYQRGADHSGGEAGAHLRPVLPAGQLPRHPHGRRGPWLGHSQGNPCPPRRDDPGCQRGQPDHLYRPPAPAGGRRKKFVRFPQENHRRFAGTSTDLREANLIRSFHQERRWAPERT